MYQVSLKSEGVHPFFVITWPGITHLSPHGTTTGRSKETRMSISQPW